MDREIFERVRSVIVNQLGVREDEVTPDATFAEDLGADSLDQVELIMAFENEFNLTIPDEDAEKIRTVADSVRYLEAQLKAEVET